MAKRIRVTITYRTNSGDVWDMYCDSTEVDWNIQELNKNQCTIISVNLGGTP